MSPMVSNRMIFDPEGKVTLNDSKSTAEMSCAMSGTRDPCSVPLISSSNYSLMLICRRLYNPRALSLGYLNVFSLVFTSLSF